MTTKPFDNRKRVKELYEEYNPDCLNRVQVKGFMTDANELNKDEANDFQKFVDIGIAAFQHPTQASRFSMKVRFGFEFFFSRIPKSINGEIGSEKHVWFIREAMKIFPNLGEINEEVYLHEELSNAWLKRRYFQLSIAKIFNEENTEFFKKVLDRFRNRGAEEMVHVVTSILETFVRALVLTANHRFERVRHLISQSTAALEFIYKKDQFAVPQGPDNNHFTKNITVPQGPDNTHQFHRQDNDFFSLEKDSDMDIIFGINAHKHIIDYKHLDRVVMKYGNKMRDAGQRSDFLQRFIILTGSAQRKFMLEIAERERILKKQNIVAYTYEDDQFNEDDRKKLNDDIESLNGKVSDERRCDYECTGYEVIVIRRLAKEGQGEGQYLGHGEYVTHEKGDGLRINFFCSSAGEGKALMFYVEKHAREKNLRFLYIGLAVNTALFFYLDLGFLPQKDKSVENLQKIGSMYT